MDDKALQRLAFAMYQNVMTMNVFDGTNYIAERLTDLRKACMNTAGDYVSEVSKQLEGDIPGNIVQALKILSAHIREL